MKPREYQWETEEPLRELLVRVTAHVWGRDTPARGPSYASGGSPAEPREVEIAVELRSCPSHPDKCEGCEWDDITETGTQYWPFRMSERNRWETWLDTLRDVAIEKDDDAEEYARERAGERGEE